MHKPSDDAIAPPSAGAEPALPMSGQVDSAAALTGTPDLGLSLDTLTTSDTADTADTPAGTDALAVPAADSHMPLAAVSEYADALNLAERLVAELGAWASMLAERWAPSLGPFFASDGRTAVDSCEILSTLDAELSAPTY